MNTVCSIVSIHSCRIPPRLKLVATRLGSLILLFQRMPVVQFLFPEANLIGGASVANTISLAVTTVVGLGAYDSVAGATATITQVSPINSTSEKKVPAAVGSLLTFSFKCTAPSIAERWACTPNPPAHGLVHTNITHNNTDSITGIPTTAGTYPVNIEVWGDPAEPDQYKLQAFTIVVDAKIITADPASTSISSGSTARLEVFGALGTGTGLAYQWYQGTSPSITTPVSGANSAVFTTPALSTTTSYWVKVTRNGTFTANAYSVVANSNTATVTVSASASVSVAVSPSSVLENSGSAMVYTFTRTGSTTSSLTANYTAAGSAIAGIDYPGTTGTVTFAAGSATATVSITPTGDTTVEPNETVTLTVGTGTGYTAGGSAAIGTITNDDTPYSSWAADGLLTGGPTEMPMGDGVTNLEKFAFNLNPRAPDVRHLTVGANGLAGLPGGAVFGGKLRLEFLRRRADANPSPGITYTAQFGSDLAGWSDIPVGTPSGIVIDGTWERVTVNDPDLTGGTARFGRVKVIQVP